MLFLNMKKYIILLIILVISLILLIKLIGLPEQEPVITSKTPNQESSRKTESITEGNNSRRYDLSEQLYEGDYDTKVGSGSEIEVNTQKLRNYAEAFVAVQSYMERAGSKANYKETTKIVRNYGLSVDEYTRISTLMNENPMFREKVQELIHKVNDFSLVEL